MPDLPNLDDWLERLIPAVRANSHRLLELGCGAGLDAGALAAAGFDVVAFDRSAERLSAANEAVPTATFLRVTLDGPLPFRDATFDLAVASLSLHYLPWASTLAAFAEVRRVLRQGGWLAFRVNATDDTNFGAGKGVELEPGYFLVADPTSSEPRKRFFDEAAVRACLAEGFAIVAIQHGWISRWGKPKRVWECLARAR